MPKASPMRKFDSQHDESLVNTQYTGATISLSSNSEVLGFHSRIWLRAEAEGNGKPVARMHHAMIDPKVTNSVGWSCCASGCEAIVTWNSVCMTKSGVGWILKRQIKSRAENPVLADFRL